jgi:hypothetical protein
MSTAQLECVVRLTGPLGDRDAKPVEHADREDSPPGLNTQADITSRRPSVRRLNEMQRTKASNCIDTKDPSTRTDITVRRGCTGHAWPQLAV